MSKNNLKLIYLLSIAIPTVVIAMPNFNNQDELLESELDMLSNPEETGPYLEGDIKGEAEAFSKIQRNGLVDNSYKWPLAAVPYEIEGSFSSSELGIISHAFNEYHTKTCVRFRKRSRERNYIVLTNKPSGCWASVGRVGGRQEVNLESRRCFSNYGTTIHELMHALGFHHEQNRYERDAYVKVLMENIKPNMSINFRKLSYNTATGYGVNYDYGSVMHYKSTSFTKNGQPTLAALKAIPNGVIMGQRNGFSEGDVFKIKAMYRCQ